MELVRAIEERRSIRKYEEKDISNEILKELIRCATLAPSGHNRQPWKFQIVRGEIKNKIADTLYQKTIGIEGSTAPHTSGIIKETPVLLVVYLTEYNAENYLYDILSIGGAIENLLLRATDMGIGSLWIGNTSLIEDELKEILKTNLRVISTIALGYKAQEPHARPRKSLEEVMITGED